MSDVVLLAGDLTCGGEIVGRVERRPLKRLAAVEADGRRWEVVRTMPPRGGQLVVLEDGAKVAHWFPNRMLRGGALERGEETLTLRRKGFGARWTLRADQTLVATFRVDAARVVAHPERRVADLLLLGLMCHLVLFDIEAGKAAPVADGGGA